ncbi:hypothetical protein D3C87_1087770 [compost metagenome]
MVVRWRSGEDFVLDGIDVPDRAIGKLDLLDLRKRIARGTTFEEKPNPHAVGCAHDREH